MIQEKAFKLAIDALLEYDYAKTDKADALGLAAIKALEAAIAQPATVEIPPILVGGEDSN